jgi:sirohydrochlorin cobaltochelatase
MTHFSPKPEAALVLLGHGSTVNPDSSAPTWQHADELRRRGLFGEVVCAFWKEQPGFREVFNMLDATEVYVVPNFISEGYFTQEVLPRELRLEGRISHLDGKSIFYCDPVGIHPSMTRLLLERAAEVAPGVPPALISLVIAGHGTGLNENSAEAIKSQVARIREAELGFAEVAGAFMEEPPLISRWQEITTAPHVVVVPFFIADGLHSYEEIPVMLGIKATSSGAASANSAEVFRHNPYYLRGRRLYYSPAIGTQPMMADVILDQVLAFDKEYRPPARDDAEI